MTFRSPLIIGALLAGSIASVLHFPGTSSAPGRDMTIPAPVLDTRLAVASSEETAVFAGGCFWGIEAVFEHVKGVKSAESGYAGGKTANPSYDDVTSGETGHAEAVRVVYDPSQVSYAKLLQIFFSVAHDPTQLNRQGPDVGTQYRSVLFYASDEQKRLAEGYIAQLTKAKTFPRAIVTDVQPLREFYSAERYHQDYMARNPNAPYIVYHDRPKVAQLERNFPELFTKPAKYR